MLPKNGESQIFDVESESTKDKFYIDVDRRGRIELSRFKLQNRYAMTKLPLVRIDIDSPPHLNPDGTRSTSFIPCTAFSQSADNMSKYTKKGSLVGVEGRLNQRNFTRQDNSKASVLEVICDSVQFLEPKGSSENAEAPVFHDEQPANNSSDNFDALDLPDDDLPF